MLVTTNVYKLIDYFSFSLWFWTGIATSCIIALRIKKPDLERPIKYTLLLPITFTMACLLLTLFSLYMQPTTSMIGILVQLLALPFYYLIKIKQSKEKKAKESKNAKDADKKKEGSTGKLHLDTAEIQIHRFNHLVLSNPDYFSIIVQKILLVVVPEENVIQTDI